MVDPDPMEEADPITAVREKLQGTYHGICINDRLYYDPPTDSVFLESDTSFVEFVPQIDYCTAFPEYYEITNAMEIYDAPVAVCFTDSTLADGIRSSFHVSVYLWSFEWNVNEDSIKTYYRETVPFPTAPLYTISKIRRYTLIR